MPQFSVSLDTFSDSVALYGAQVYNENYAVPTFDRCGCYVHLVPWVVRTCGDLQPPADANCLDLYTATLNAIRAYQYQPAGAGTLNPPQSARAYWEIQSFTGGLLKGTPLAFTPPPGQGTPTSASFYNQYFTNCTDPNGVQTTVEIDVSVTNTSTVTSSQETMSSDTKALGGSTEVTLSYSSPGVIGGPSGSASQTFTYGTTSTTSTTGSITNEGGTGTQINNIVIVSLTIPYQTKVLVSGQTTLTEYTGVPWTANVKLTGTIGPNVPYLQRWENTIPPDEVKKFGDGISANVWYPVKTWYSGTNGGYAQSLSSPNGVYVFFPNWTSYLVGIELTGTNASQIYYYEHLKNQTENEGMILRHDAGPCTGGCAGTLWATNLAGNYVTWDSNQSPVYLAMRDDGILAGYANNWKQIWSSGKSPSSNRNNPLQSFNGLTPEQLLGPGEVAFQATGDYTGHTYGTEGYVYTYSPEPITCKPPTPSSSALSASPPGDTAPREKLHPEVLASGGFGKPAAKIAVNKLRFGSDAGTRLLLSPGPSAPPSANPPTKTKVKITYKPN